MVGTFRTIVRGRPYERFSTARLAYRHPELTDQTNWNVVGAEGRSLFSMSAGSTDSYAVPKAERDTGGTLAALQNTKSLKSFALPRDSNPCFRRERAISDFETHRR